MRFVEGLGLLVERHGGEFLGTEAVVGELDSKGVFSGRPALRTVFRMAVNSRCVARLVESGLWDENVESMIEKFIIHTGFQSGLVRFVFNGVAVALGYDVPGECSAEGDSRDTDECIIAEPSERWDVAYGEDKNAWPSVGSPARRAAFLTSVIEIEREIEPLLGITVRAVSCNKVGERYFELTFELARVEPRATGALYYAVYDREGLIITTALAGALCFEDASRLPLSVRIVCEPERVARVLLFWQS